MTDLAGLVKAWEDQVDIPTYGVGEPNKNPMFLEKRVYQGSSGVVYPHPIIDEVESTASPQTYTAVFLENQYLKIMLLPELGGRVQMALDKTNSYHFVYYNQVIKPALVGLAGPWISGGIEFNWPQHHRPSTFEPVDYLLEANPDGSQTIWFNQVERMFRTKGLVGFTLYPDAAYLELSVQLYNRTPTPQTFLWWANPAVHVNDEYQSVFPPDVHAVMDHGKRAVSDFPIATGEYYKMDYSPGTDISRYKNIPVPTSFMAYHSDFDFIGCYDHGQEAGMMHVANHHLVPGKKQWTWGNGDFGKAWDRQLTDEDGPYIELMCGAFTDNQPDFSWLQPGEEKHFQQVFMPYKGIGAAKNASREVVLNLEVADGQAELGVYVSRPRTVNIQLAAGDTLIYENKLALDPATSLRDTTDTDAIPQALTLRVLDESGHELLSYTPLPDEKPDVPDPATPAPPPAEVESNEELFLHGLHLEQYRHATYQPEPYYEEVLRRDSGDSRANNALGLLLLRRGKFAAAEPYFRAAIERITTRNPNPYDSEAFFNLGQTLKMQGHYDEAYDAFYKAVWSFGVRAASYYEIARIDCRRGDFSVAVEHLDRAIASNTRHHQARHLKVACLRKLDRADDAQQEITQVTVLDRFNVGVYYEQALLTGDYTLFTRLMRGWVHNYIELALDYAHPGLFEDAIAILKLAPMDDPMVLYYLARCYMRLGDVDAARQTLEEAAVAPSDYCFPNRIEAVPTLQWAMDENPEDAKAPYYLGNFWYAHRRYQEAIDAWEASAQRDDTFPTVYRNLGLAYVNKRADADRARAAYEHAFALDPADARVFFELDQLHKKMGVSPSDRLHNLEAHLPLTRSRDDLLLEYVTLFNLTGRYEEALAILSEHIFHPWEGGEGRISEQYVLSLLQLARQALADSRPGEAISHLQKAFTYPPNLNEGKLATTQDNHLYYYLGVAHGMQGDETAARSAFQQAIVGSAELTSAMYYNDQPPDMIFFQGLAHAELGDMQAAHQTFQRLVAYGEEHLNDDIQMDYFAVSLPNFLVFDDDLTLRHRIHCHYMMMLGYIGLAQREDAAQQFQQLVSLEPAHVGAHAHRQLLDKPKSTTP